LGAWRGGRGRALLGQRRQLIDLGLEALSVSRAQTDEVHAHAQLFGRDDFAVAGDRLRVAGQRERQRDLGAQGQGNGVHEEGPTHRQVRGALVVEFTLAGGLDPQLDRDAGLSTFFLRSSHTIAALMP
jgi:hypothetical protein